MWLPFFFSDTKTGRHSGILPPQFGVGDIVRNSPTYRRNVEHVGYYWALNDYMDLGTWLDWRSAAGATQRRSRMAQVQRRLELQVARPLSRRANRPRVHDAARRIDEQGDQLEPPAGFLARQPLQHATSITSRARRFSGRTPSIRTPRSRRSRRRQRISPRSDRRRSRLARRESSIPAAQQVDQTFPTLSLTSTAIGVGKWLTWTPSFSFSRSDVLHMDQPGIGRYEFFTNGTGARDSVLAKSRNSATSSITFDTPLQIFGKDLKNSFRISQQRNDFRATVPDLRRQDGRDHRDASVRGDLSHRRRLDAGLFAPAVRAQSFQSVAEPQSSERRSRTVLGRVGAKRRPLRHSIEAVHRRTLGVPDDVRCSADSVRSSGSAIRSVQRSATPSRPRPASATNISSRSAERERDISAA